MTDKEIRRMKDGVIRIFEKFNILDHAATIGSLRDDILRLIGSMQERPGLKFNVGDKVRNDKIAGLPICTIESIDDTTYYCDYTNFDIIVQDKWELVVEPKDCMYSKDNYTDEDRKVLCGGCEEERCKYSKLNTMLDDALSKETKENWNKRLKEETKESVNEDLEGEINRYLSTWSTSKDNGIVFCEKMARHFAAWQKQKDAEAINENALLYSARLEGIEIGKAEMKQNMMRDAIETSVCAMLDGIHIDILPKQLKGYRFGDKVKVLIIKCD